MESILHTQGALSALPWVPVNVGGSKLLAKAWFGDSEYQLLLSDLNNVWEEKMSTNRIERRAQDLNKRLKAPVQTLIAHLRCVAWPCLSGQSGEQNTAVHFVLKHEEDNLTVKLKSELGGVPFYWEFCCTPASVVVVSRELLRPLMSMTQVLHGRVGELTTLLLKKDAEIQDYKENGAVLSRGRLQTEPFEEVTHRRRFYQRLPEMLQDRLEFNSELQELYVSVCDVRNARKRKHSGQLGSSSEDSCAPDQAHITVPTDLKPASPGSCTKQHVEETQFADTNQTAGLFLTASAATPADRSVRHLKKKNATGLFK